MTREEMEQAVERGMALLDEKEPAGWWKPRKIALWRLDIASSYACVCGQLHGVYGDGINYLGIDFGDEASEYGFVINEDDYRERFGDDIAAWDRQDVADSRTLTAIWREKIRERRRKGADQ